MTAIISRPPIPVKHIAMRASLVVRPLRDHSAEAESGGGGGNRNRNGCGQCLTEREENPVRYGDVHRLLPDLIQERAPVVLIVAHDDSLQPKNGDDVAAGRVIDDVRGSAPRRGVIRGVLATSESPISRVLQVRWRIDDLSFSVSSDANDADIQQVADATNLFNLDDVHSSRGYDFSRAPPDGIPPTLIYKRRQAPLARFLSVQRLPCVAAVHACIITPLQIDDQRAVVQNPNPFNGFHRQHRGCQDRQGPPRRWRAAPNAMGAYACGDSRLCGICEEASAAYQHNSACPEYRSREGHSGAHTTTHGRRESTHANCPSASRSLAVTMETLAALERWPSGLRRWSRKPVWVHAHRGFESHPLRHAAAAPRRGARVAE